MIYHRLTNTEGAIDFRRVAERTSEVRGASGFDRPLVLEAVEARLREAFASMDTGEEFTLRVSDWITQYDHELGEFAIQLFTPGRYVAVSALGRRYPMVFANAGSVRAISLPPVEARAFDERLQRLGRSVVNEVRFRVVGGGDPSGAVAGEVIRAELLSFRLLDHNGGLVWEPSGPIVADEAATRESPMLGREVEIAGFRVPDQAQALERTLERLFGSVQRGRPASPPDPRLVGRLAVNQGGCFSFQTPPAVGTVCMTALFDEGGVVRWIEVERILPTMDDDAIREAIVHRYGPVAASRNARGGLHLGWGPPMQVPSEGNWSPRALEVQYEWTRDGLGTNRRPSIRLRMRLADAEWLGTRPNG